MSGMKSLNVLPSNNDVPCHACSRIHRKLYLIDKYWLGQNCTEDYQLYLTNPDINSLYWHGWEKKHAKIKFMLTGKRN